MVVNRPTPRTTRVCFQRQRGVALITVLLILVVMSTLAVYLLEDQHLVLRRITNQRDAEQAFQLATGAEQWGAKVLLRDMQNSQTDHLQENWHSLLPQIPVERGTLTTRIDDLQGRFNINNLAAGRDAVWYPAFKRLLQAVDLDESLADAVVDWIDPDSNPQGVGGAEDPQYLSEQIPYRAGNRRLENIGELIWVRGFDKAKVAKLAPYISALPAQNVLINVNTALPTVLRVISKDGLSDSAAASIAEGRGENGYADLKDVLKLPALAGQGDTAQALLTVSSNYFEIVSVAGYGRFQLQLLSTIARNPQTQQTVLLQRRRGIS